MSAVGTLWSSGGDGEVGPTHAAVGHAQPVERLRGGHLVHQVQVDVEQVGLAVSAFGHQMAVPDLLAQRPRRAAGSARRAC